MTLYKTLDESGHGPYSGFDWPKPTKREDGAWEPGEWVEAEGKLEMCVNGIHYCQSTEQLLGWFNAQIYEIEVAGEFHCDYNKCIARRGRLVRRIEPWNERIARLFACDCAERVLHIYESKHDDDRPRRAIEVARQYANGEATKDELVAPWAAAEVAAWDAAEVAPWAAASAARASAAVGVAAWAAASAARASAAHGSAAWAAAWDAEREWQVGRLQEYWGGE